MVLVLKSANNIIDELATSILSNKLSDEKAMAISSNDIELKFKYE